MIQPLTVVPRFQWKTYNDLPANSQMREPFEGVDLDTYKAFIDYFLERPWLWFAFHNKAVEAVNAGLKKYSAKTIMEVIRWECDTSNLGLMGDDFKVCNSWISYYARAFHRRYQNHPIFELRETKGVTSWREAA